MISTEQSVSLHFRRAVGTFIDGKGFTATDPRRRVKHALGLTVVPLNTTGVGVPKFARLKILKNSARNCKPIRSKIVTAPEEPKFQVGCFQFLAD